MNEQIRMPPHWDQKRPRSLVCCGFALLVASFLPEIGDANDRANPRNTVREATCPLAEHLQILDRQGVASDTDRLLDFLRRQRMSPQQQRDIAMLIQQLASDDFFEREAATQKLIDLGNGAKPQVALATQSKDPETTWRSQAILKRLDSADQKDRHNSLLLAALSILKSRQDPKAVPVLLETLPFLEESHLKNLAAETLWAAADSSHESLLREAISGEHLDAKSASIVALELALGEKAVGTLLPYLQSKSSRLRLAAARALIDWKPRECIPVLVQLVADPSDEVSWQADALLQMLSDQRMEWTAERSLAQAWQTWSIQQLPMRKLHLPVGEKRLDLEAGRNSLRESFSRPVKTLVNNYGVFRYEANNAGTASVLNGQLLIQGEKNDGDQRLYTTSDRMIGRATWPRIVEVRTRLGGKPGNNFGWHIGVSVGRVKVLFHPGLSGGEFRVESTDDHHYVFPNENMGFTPAAGPLHEMSIKATKQSQGAEFLVTVREKNTQKTFHRKFSVSNEQLGTFNRIGLERSGRQGGAAMFDDVVIRLTR